MRIAYATTDEVNQAMVARIAESFGAAVTQYDPGRPETPDQFDAFLYDLDSVPAGDRMALLVEILSSSSPQPKAVHGYCLSEEQATALQRHGISVAQRLQPKLVRTLCRQTLRGLSTMPAEVAMTELTWIDLTE
jgi:hypothetical protein